MIKVWQKKAKETEHGLMVAKRRTKEELYDQGGKYKNLKGEHKVFVKVKVRHHNSKYYNFNEINPNIFAFIKNIRTNLRCKN